MQSHPDKAIHIKDYGYDLPTNLIAQYPLAERDQSRLLVYKTGVIKHKQFTQINEFLPPQATLFFNDTKVIPARLIFQKETGANIEIFLLGPISPYTLVQQAMEATGSSQWQCTIGNLKRWPDNASLIKKKDGLTLCASLVNRAEGIVEFTWQPESISFAEVINLTGFTPLPPYLNREAETRDAVTYQTVYSHHAGAVAAPTAGLHFTNRILDDLHAQGHSMEFITLHVSAGTFQPVKVQNAIEHPMHQEQLIVSRKNIEAIFNAKSIVAVGTTSLRTLESLYWYGVKLKTNPKAPFHITQHDPYNLENGVSMKEAFEYILDLLTQKEADTLTGETSIYIVPGYSFRVVEALITNFHQPASTLILLVAAFVGADWKNIYDEARDQAYRFLSYGDSSILYRN
jgi:S-adenosylmethionine:tRNA ribosyltransferase-isomerase